jgi:hypothetical protein
MILKKVEKFILETIMDQNWQLFLSFICFNVAYLLADFPLCSYLLSGAGLSLLISTVFGIFSVSTVFLKTYNLFCLNSLFHVT